MKEININGAFMKCYPLCAAQRLHYYTVKYSPEQVLCIGTGLYVIAAFRDFLISTSAATATAAGTTRTA